MQVAALGSGNPLPPLLSLLTSVPGRFAPTVLQATPQLATLTLAYNPLCAGASVLVAPLDGGGINGSRGAKTMVVGVNGTLTFSFQAPSAHGRYYVVTRLDGVETAFPFDVASP